MSQIDDYLNAIIEPTSSKLWKQMQRTTVDHWAELPKSSHKNGSSENMSKEIKILTEIPTETAHLS